MFWISRLPNEAIHEKRKKSWKSFKKCRFWILFTRSYEKYATVFADGYWFVVRVSHLVLLNFRSTYLYINIYICWGRERVTRGDRCVTTTSSESRCNLDDRPQPLFIPFAFVFLLIACYVGREKAISNFLEIELFCCSRASCMKFGCAGFSDLENSSSRRCIKNRRYQNGDAIVGGRDADKLVLTSWHLGAWGSLQPCCTRYEVHEFFPYDHWIKHQSLQSRKEYSCLISTITTLFSCILTSCVRRRCYTKLNPRWIHNFLNTRNGRAIYFQKIDTILKLQG